MTKKIFLTTLCALALCPAFAQTSGTEEKVEYSTDKYKVETNRFWSNWFFSVGGGANIMFSDHDKQASFGDRIAPSLEINVGKWFIPGVGVRLGYQGLSVKGVANTTQDGPSHETGEAFASGSGFKLYEQKFKMFNLYGDALFNVSNLIFGYNPNRVWNVTPFIGLGWGRVWESPQYKGLTASLGVQNSFRLNDALNLNIEVRGMMTDDDFDAGKGGAAHDGVLSATVGLTYKFKPRGWSRAKTVYRSNYNDLESMRQKLNDLSAENDRLKKALAAGDHQQAQTIVKKIAAGNLITFQLNKAELSNEARVNLGLLAEIIKSGDKDVVYTVTGYADAGTGSDENNERLSKERAEAVYNCLVKEFGVSEKQLRIDYKGGVGNMFYDDPRLSRAVITYGE